MVVTSVAYKVFVGRLTAKGVRPIEEEKEEVITPPSPLLTKIADQVCALLAPPVAQRPQAVVASMDNMQVGVTVARKIRMHQLGVVTNLTYAWGTVKYIQQVWVKWAGKREATPYTLTELLVVTIH